MDRSLRRHYHLDDPVAFADRALTLLRKGHGPGMPSDSDFLLDYAASALHELQQARGGFVYAAVNPIYPNLVKIGMTRLEPEARLLSLSSAGVPVAFRLAGAAWFPDRHWAEASIHRVLQRYWATKEFYAVKFDRAVREIEHLAKSEQALFEALAGPGTVKPNNI